MQYELPLNSQPPEKNWEETVRDEILYKWSDEQRRARYQALIGQLPKPDLSLEGIVQGILKPEQENLRVMEENREEDRDEILRTYGRLPK